MKYFMSMSRPLALCAALGLLALSRFVMQGAHVSAALAIAATVGVIVGATTGSVRGATILVAALMTSVLALTAFQWQLIDAASLFFVIFLEMWVQIGTAAAVGFTVAVAVRHWRAARWRALAPVLTCAVGWALWFSVPWTAINLRIVWYARHEGFDRVIALVHRGDIAGQGDVQLPSRWRSLSSDGAIAIHGDGDSLTVLFYTFRGFLHHASGYVYVARDTSPTPAQLNSDIREVERERPHWYFVSLY